MIGESQALALIEGLVRLGGKDAVEVVLTTTDRALTRYADNQIHQNLATRDACVTLRVALGKRLGTVTTNDMAFESLRGALQRARELAALQPENPHFAGFAGPEPDEPYSCFQPATAAATPQDRAALVLGLAGMTRAEGMRACGRVSTTVTERAVANSQGVRRYGRATAADMVAVVSNDDGGTGYACRVRPGFAALAVEELAAEAIGTCRMAEDPETIPAGAYDVVLRPYAVGTLVEYLAYAGLGGLAFAEGRSFLSGRLGERVTGPAITLWDDPRDPFLPGLPHDAEGVPTRRLDLIGQGIGQGIALDTPTAARLGRRSTGHALAAPNPAGPQTTHLVLAEGQGTLDDLVRKVERGLLVTRFHYTNLVEPKRTLATGLTKDGLLRIEDGEIVGAARNLRFTDAILEAFARNDGLSAEWQVGGEFGVLVRAPGMLIRNLRFNGQAGS